jgi:hypothetical protein
VGDDTGLGGSRYTLLARGPPHEPVGSLPLHGMLQAWLLPYCKAVASLLPAHTRKHTNKKCTEPQ